MKDVVDGGAAGQAFVSRQQESKDTGQDQQGSENEQNIIVETFHTPLFDREGKTVLL